MKSFNSDNNENISSNVVHRINRVDSVTNGFWVPRGVTMYKIC